MKTSEFLPVAKKITETGLFYNLKKGERGIKFLGSTYFGSTENHYKIIWRKYGTLRNITLTETAEIVNKILLENKISEFKAIPTKSGRFCRLEEVK